MEIRTFLVDDFVAHYIQPSSVIKASFSLPRFHSLLNETYDAHLMFDTLCVCVSIMWVTLHVY